MQSYAYSSYSQYLGLTHVDWLHPEDILGYYPKSGKKGYREFVEGPSSVDGATMIAKLIIDEDDA